ncbi:ferredoxin [Streptomyces chartreusis]
MKIIVDRGRCTGIGICESVAPDHFEVDGDGALHLLVAEPDEADAALLGEAVRSCPALALSIENGT